MVKIAISGVCGRMGSQIFSLAKQDKGIEIVGVLEQKSHPEIGKEIIPGLKILSELNEFVSQTDVLIEFTTPESTLQHLDIVEKSKKSIVIGTTGFKDTEISKITTTAKKNPVVLSPNMSIGVNTLFALVKEITKAVPDYDIKIVEAHHNKKKDAPSGTAKKLAEIISKSLNRSEEIGILSVRAGDIVGEHTIIFAGQGERIELVHRAHSRDTFAAGAIRAAKWLTGKPPGLYDMQDVLWGRT